MRTFPLYAAKLALLLALTTLNAQARAEGLRQTAVVKVVQNAKPSVVAIKAERTLRGRSNTSNGTGVIIDERGFIVTSHHVVVAASDVQVQLSDRRTNLAAKVVVEDKAHDLAVLQVSTDKNLPALKLGPGTDLIEGEEVIAIGNPYGYSFTVTRGIISALGRDIELPNGELLNDLIQTDASINPGNSGGPLLNINGELIGIVAAVRDGAQGIAFAINAETVKKVLAERLTARQVSGLTHGLRTAEEVAAAEGKQRQKVVVERVERDGPASEAGLLRGDAIVQVGSLSVTNRFDLERALWGHRPGEQVAVTVVREGKPMKVALTLTEAGSGAKVVSRDP